ncbi:Uncharacterised protein [uncultured archaeon]|nr:Uncharacterised protein [uncultured archaeon]
MAARTIIIATRVELEPLNDMDLAALEEDDDSTVEELQALIESEKDDFISLEEYAKRRGISL